MKNQSLTARKSSVLYITLFTFCFFIYDGAVCGQIEIDSILPPFSKLQRPAQPTTIALSPDGSQLVLGTSSGYLATISTITEKMIWKTRISQGYAKHATFALNGKQFYLGEQSADGFIFCYDVSKSRKPKLLWKYRLANDIDTSIPENPDDYYAWIQYPGPHRIAATSQGDLIVAAVHSWYKDGQSLIKSQLYRFDAKTGNPIWKFPSERPLPMIIRWFDYSHDGRTIAFVCDKHSADQSIGDLKPGSLYIVDGETGKIRWGHTFTALTPYFDQVTFWRGVAVSPDGKSIGVTTNDGRAFIFSEEKPIWQEDLTTPIEISGIPITATSGTVGTTNEFIIFITGDTFVPYHLQKGVKRPPTTHPNGLTLFGYQWNGQKSWQWKLENMPQGLCIDLSGKYAAIPISRYGQTDTERPNGVSIFDLTTEGGGLEKYLRTYRLAGQIPYDMIAIDRNGRQIAVVETVINTSGEEQQGKNQVHIITTEIKDTN
ncbi:TPA: hypothetical protein EYN09_20680 [Candidatus Poribacteria bacterium]|nr:hypothetical protein [Candidatus Poribacteria bacterium]HIB98546.1 hypothetical protein [Candidatus Poribacteria bacterium]HIO09336.1 hypothetical protein [Candidatus Poribacteria bacterium]